MSAGIVYQFSTKGSVVTLEVYCPIERLSASVIQSGVLSSGVRRANEDTLMINVLQTQQKELIVFYSCKTRIQKKLSLPVMNTSGSRGAEPALS